MPAKTVILLEKLGPDSLRYLLWADVPVGRQPRYADPIKKSAYKDASAAELLELQQGKVAERVDVVNFPASATQGQKLALLVAAQAAFQAEIDGKNDWSQYGTYHNGTVWTNIVGT